MPLLTQDYLASYPINLSYLLAEAQKQGYRVEQLETTTLRYLHQITDVGTGKTFVVRKTNVYPELTDQVFQLTKHKQKTADFLLKHGFRTPRSTMFKTPQELVKLWKDFYHCSPVVLKPEYSGLGKGVYITPAKENMLSAATDILENFGPNGLIQDYVAGLDLRVQVVGGKLMAACIRLPAHIVGNGVNTIKELINQKNITKIKYNPQNDITLNDDAFNLLKKQGHSLTTVLSKGQHCLLHEAANIGLGGDAIDVTDAIGRSMARLVEKISRLLGIKVFAIDIITPLSQENIAQVTPENSWIIEINAPCMWAHHHFVDGQKRNIALAILESYFDPDNFDPNNPHYLLQM